MGGTHDVNQPLSSAFPNVQSELDSPCVGGKLGFMLKHIIISLVANLDLILSLYMFKEALYILQ